MKVFGHDGYPLNLIDLEMRYASEKEEYDVDDDEDDALVIEENFRRPCKRCHQEINQYHRYYKCTCSDSCNYSIHKFCAELPKTLKHTSHNAHTDLVLTLDSVYNWQCDICQTRHEPHKIRYRCTQCYFSVGISCAMVVNENIIHHPSHIHPLVQIPEPILCKCLACGKKHQGFFYHCTTCPHFFIHNDCALLPKKLLIQHTTNVEFSHTHALTLSYSFPIADQEKKFYPNCRVCGIDFYRDYEKKSWIYKCDKCWFYTHVDCATSRGEPFMSIFSSAGLGKTHKNFEDVDHPDVLHLPFPDQTYNILKHKFFKELGSRAFGTDEGNLTHMSHQHPLILVDTQRNDIRKPTSSEIKTLSCHNPMKKIELLCNGCLRPIMTMPFYKCANEDELCNFVLHEWCTQLPDQVQNHPGHLQHTLVLLPNVPRKFFGVFQCPICQLHCNGFVYSCVQCEYHIDVSCAFIPKKITHKAHPNHLLWLVQSKPSRKACRACSQGFYGHSFSFSCHTCDFDLHPGCALLLPQTIRHKYDKHPMNLSYFPIENHKSEYFCEICEKEFNPNDWFYHCYDCAQSINSACVPLILECERATTNPYDHSAIYKFVNIKFGGIHNIEDHPHSLSFVQGTARDGFCTRCSSTLQYEMIFKCLRCKFAIHFDCKDVASTGCSIM